MRWFLRVCGIFIYLGSKMGKSDTYQQLECPGSEVFHARLQVIFQVQVASRTLLTDSLHLGQSFYVPLILRPFVCFLDGQEGDLTVRHTSHVPACRALHTDHCRQAHVFPALPSLWTSLLWCQAGICSLFPHPHLPSLSAAFSQVSPFTF